MPVSRRRFLRSSTFGSLAAGLTLKSNSSALGSDLNHASDQAWGFDYSRANFEPHVGSTFRLSQGKQIINLKLVKLTDYQKPSLKGSARSRKTESFVLGFRAPQKISRSSTYQLEHPKLGSFDLFIARNGDRDDMTAVINRIV